MLKPGLKSGTPVIYCVGFGKGFAEIDSEDEHEKAYLVELESGLFVTFSYFELIHVPCSGQLWCDPSKRDTLLTVEAWEPFSVGISSKGEYSDVGIETMLNWELIGIRKESRAFLKSSRIDALKQAEEAAGFSG